MITITDLPFIKIIVLFWMLIDLGQIYLPSLDISNSWGEEGDFPIYVVWQINYLIIAVFILGILLEINIYMNMVWLYL